MLVGFEVIKAIANFILFQLAWFAAVVGGALGWPILGVLSAIVVVAIHFGSYLAQLKQEIILVLGVTALGAIFENSIHCPWHAGTMPDLVTVLRCRRFGS